MKMRQVTRWLQFIVTVKLQLSAPYTPEIKVIFAIVFECTGIYAIAPFHRMRLGQERPRRSVADGHTQTKNIVLIFQWKIHIVLSVFIGHIGVPQLPAGPRNIFDGQGDTMVNGFRIFIIHGKNMILLHIKMISVMVFGYTTLPVMGRVYIDFIFKHMSGWIGHIIMRKQISGSLHCITFFESYLLNQ